MNYESLIFVLIFDSLACLPGRILGVLVDSISDVQKITIMSSTKSGGQTKLEVGWCPSTFDGLSYFPCLNLHWLCSP